MRALAVAFLLLLSTVLAEGETLRLDGDQFWVGLASATTADEAIGIAQTFDIRPIEVVTSANGWFAAITGPYHVSPGKGRAVLDALHKDKGYPPDAYLTRGASYGEVVWTPPPDHVEAILQYDGEHDAELVRGDLRLAMSRQSDGKDHFVPVLSAAFKGKAAFRVTLGSENPSEKPAAVTRLVRLDPASSQPSIVSTYFWQGAHCCTVTKLATLRPDGTWAIVSTDALDGDGYQFEDLDKSGRSYLVSGDQSFLYTFASYAGSFAPPKIQKLDGGQLVDLTQDPSMRRFIVQDMWRQKAFAKQQDEPKSNGYLAAFVADELILGDGKTAWQTMLANYDRTDTTFGIDKCTIDAPVATCPENRLVKLPFPEGLRQFLSEHGYMNNPDYFPVPTEATLHPPQPDAAPSMPPVVPPQLQSCAEAAETVRKLIYQQFAGRALNEGETFDDVVLDGDETLEDYNAAIAKVTCAVSYLFKPRALIGRLAEDGNMARAASLGRMSRLRGGSINGRVRYTVKPTATAGTSYIEILQ